MPFHGQPRLIFDPILAQLYSPLQHSFGQIRFVQNATEGLVGTFDYWVSLEIQAELLGGASQG